MLVVGGKQALTWWGNLNMVAKEYNGSRDDSGREDVKLDYGIS